ncbi:hypothetical protein, partial [Klebsiella pneumoniae]|uniref:hypothetical protein n=1 Tax=Klebsiella pneumoniae TaxID=573 RepID=UPI003EBDC046
KQTATDLVVLSSLFVGNYTTATTSSMSTRKGQKARRLSPTHQTLQPKPAGKREKDHHVAERAIMEIS